MKRFVLFLLCLLCFVPLVCTQPSATSADEVGKIVATSCFLYQDVEGLQPIKDDQGEIVMLKFDDRVSILDGGQESEKYYYVSFGQYTGYVFKFYVNKNFAEDQSVYPVFNAKVAVDGAHVYTQPNDEAKTDIVLGRDQQLYIYEGYKKNQDYTAVGFIDEQGHMYYGYLRTVDLEPYGVNAGLITGIVVAASTITILLLLIFMKKSKKVKKD